MAIKPYRHTFTGLTTPYTSYDSTRTNLGALICQNTGANPEDKWAGPLPVALGRPMEGNPVNIAVFFPHVVKWSATIYWLFLVENATGASASRRVVWYEYNKTTKALNWKGYVTLTLNTATAHTQRGFRVLYKVYDVGQASCAGGTAVTGNGTTWLASKMCVGSRIGFGSKDPTAITTWYQISAVGGDLAITLTANGPNTGGNVDYCIEDLKAIVVTTNATAANGGVFMAKGLRIEDFATGGTTIPAATTVDDIKAVYWLADAAVVTNTVACGVGIEAFTNWTTQYIYVIDGTASPRVFKYNCRVALAGLAAGKSTSAWVLTTGTQAATGTVSQVNNCRCDTLNHGPGSGVLSLYYVTTTRIYRAAVSNITSGNPTWNSDSMTEVPPGGVATTAATGAMSSLEVSTTLDRLIVLTTHASGTRSYVTQYRTDGGQMDYIFMIENKQIQQAGADAGLTPAPITLSQVAGCWVEDGIAFYCTNGTTVTTNFVYVWPIGVHWDFASGGGVPANQQRLITPGISTPNAIRYYYVSFNRERILGSDKLGLTPEPIRVYYRTAGISTDTGSWTLINELGDISGVAGASEIQFMFEFRIMGAFGIPARIFAVNFSYETDDDTDSHYEPSINESVVASNIFAYRQKVAFGTNIPNLRIRIYNAATSGIVLDDTVTASAYGTWEYSDDGGTTWYAWDASKDTVGYYIRYTATTLPASIIGQVLLTLA